MSAQGIIAPFEVPATIPSCVFMHFTVVVRFLGKCGQWRACLSRVHPQEVLLTHVLKLHSTTCYLHGDKCIYNVYDMYIDVIAGPWSIQWYLKLDNCELNGFVPLLWQHNHPQSHCRFWGRYILITMQLLHTYRWTRLSGPAVNPPGLLPFYLVSTQVASLHIYKVYSTSNSPLSLKFFLAS